MVGVDQLRDGPDEQFVRQLGHRQAPRGPAHPLGVGVDAEGRDAAVGLTVDLQTFEDRLTVVQHHRGRIELHRSVRLDGGVVPAAALGVVDRDHVIGEVPAETGIRQYFSAPFRGSGRGVRNMGEFEDTGHDR